MRKVRRIKDGVTEVAVLFSPNFAAGWSTWNKDFPELIFLPEVVELVLDGKLSEIEPLVDKMYDEEVYCGAVENLVVQWIPEGTEFKIEECDGSESIVFREDDDWIKA